MSTLSPFDKRVIKSITKLELEFDKLEVLDIWNSSVGRFTIKPSILGHYLDLKTDVLIL